MPGLCQPEPYGSPEPQRESPSALATLGKVALVVGSVLFVIVSCPLTFCSGATRSAHLRWEKRRSSIDAAVAPGQVDRSREPSQESAQP